MASLLAPSPLGDLDLDLAGWLDDDATDIPRSSEQARETGFALPQTLSSGQPLHQLQPCASAPQQPFNNFFGSDGQSPSNDTSLDVGSNTSCHLASGSGGQDDAWGQQVQYAFTSLPPTSQDPSAPAKSNRGRKPKPKLCDLEEEVERKMAQVKMLSEQNDFLKRKLNMLEKVVPVRDESVGFLTQMIASGAGSSTGPVALPDQLPLSVPYQVFTRGASSMSFTPTPAFTPELVEQLRGTTPRQFQQMWVGVVEKFSVAVLQAEAHGPASVAASRLNSLVASSMEYIDKVTLLAPDSFLKSLYVNLETGLPERPHDSFWLDVSRSLNLTPHQLEECSSLLKQYRVTVEPMLQERKKLVEDLAANLTAEHNLKHLDYLKMSDMDQLTEGLKRNILKEHQAHWDIGDFVCFAILTPLQIAKSCAVSYPYIPDGVAVLHACQQIQLTG